MRSLFLVFLIVLILLTFGFAIAKAGSLGGDDNWFNASHREKFARSVFFRKVFSLNNPGDAKADYLSDRAKNIVLEVDVQQGANFSSQSLAQIESRISAITGKPVQLRISSIIESGKNQYSSDEIRLVADKYRNAQPKSTEAVLYLLLLPRALETSSQIGSTLGSDGVVLFAEAISELQTDKEDMEISTVLHEFLHLLGIGHIEGPDCIMNEAVEVGGISGRNVSTDFCPDELELINLVKANY